MSTSQGTILKSYIHQGHFHTYINKTHMLLKEVWPGQRNFLIRLSFSIKCQPLLSNSLYIVYIYSQPAMYQIKQGWTDMSMVSSWNSMELGPQYFSMAHAIKKIRNLTQLGRSSSLATQASLIEYFFLSQTNSTLPTQWSIYSSRLVLTLLSQTSLKRSTRNQY